MNILIRSASAAAVFMVTTGVLAQPAQQTTSLQTISASSASPLPWMNTELSPEQRADLLIAEMTLEQKVQQISNRPIQNPMPGCLFTEIGRHIEGIPELGIPTIRMINGGTGVRGGDCGNEPVATALPSTLAAAASFNPDLSRQWGEILGDETRRDAHQVQLAPGMNLVRHPYGGRSYEYQSEDPYLSGVMASEQLKGIQSQGVFGVAKHMAGNEQETERRQMATIIPAQALHELYLLPFEMVVRDAKPAAVMCAFPWINGVSACSSPDLLTKTLRERWGFDGWVATDRRALHDLAPSIKAGVDWELAHMTPLHYSLDPQPGQPGNPGSEGIAAALAAGSITVSDIDTMLRRRYVQHFKFGHFDTDFDAFYGSPVDFVTHGQQAREFAEQGIVLLKNENNFLPLETRNLRSIALIGASWYAGMAKLPPRSIRADNVGVIAPYTVTPLQGLQSVLTAMGSQAIVTYNDGTDIASAVELARQSDVVVLMAGDNPHELCDRSTLGLPVIPPADSECPDGDAEDEEAEEGTAELQAVAGTDQEEVVGTDQEALVPAVAAANPRTVVVLKTSGMVLMPWLDDVPALIEAWYPGQEDGNAVANILFGLRNPSGKLPMTFGNTDREAAYATEAQFPGVRVDGQLTASYSEGLQMGYRWYEANDVMPVFPFGFGLSYTTFSYSDLSVESTIDETGNAVLTATYTITNTGTRQGAEASQVYLTLPGAAGQPSRRLVGFQKVDLWPGTSQTVSIAIDSSALNHPLSYFQPAPNGTWGDGDWLTAPGDYTVHVGTSSADTPLEQTINLSF